MGATYNGNASNVTSINGQTSITEPVDADAQTAGTYNLAFEKIADWVEALRTTARDRSRATAAWGADPMGGWGAGGSEIGDWTIIYAAGATTPTRRLGVATDYNGPTLELLSGVLNADSSVTPCYSTGLHYYKSYLEARTVADVALSAVGANNTSVYFGWGAAANTAARFSGVRFRKLSGNTNWQAECDDGTATTTVDTGVPPVANNAQELKILWTGSATAAGLRVLFYIDGSLVATITTNIYVGATQLGFGVELIGTAGNTTKLQLGRIDVEWTRKLGK